MTPEIPPLSSQLENINATTISSCRQQISEFFGNPIKELPFYGGRHDVLVGSYICGFLQGQLLVSEAMKEWSNGDGDLEAIGWLMMSTICVGAILGHARLLDVQAQLSQMSEAQPTKNTAKLDQAGGGDGMDYANGVKTQNGGWLLHYLKMNVKPYSVETAAERTDLAAIEANPISKFIFKKKYFWFVIGFLIALAVISSG